MYRIELPNDGRVDIVDANLNQIVPTEHRADLVVIHRGHSDAWGVVVEIQLHRDDDKKYAWQLYAAAVRAKYRCRASVLVVTPSAEIAAWAAQPIQVGLTSSETFQPIVFGPSVIPCITDCGAAQSNPELALLSVEAHGVGPNAFGVAKAALAASTRVDADHALIYTKLVLTAVPSAVRVMLEELMLDPNRNWDWVPENKVVDEFMRRPKAERVAIIEKNIERMEIAVAEGEAVGRAKALLVFLDARHIELTAEQRERILTCRDLRVLDDWITRAAAATLADDILC